MKFQVLIILAIYIQFTLASSGSGSGESETLPEDEGSGTEVVFKKNTQEKLLERYERLCAQLILFVPNLCVKYAGKCLTVCAAQIPMKELDCGLKKPPNPTKKLKVKALKRLKSKSGNVKRRKTKQNKKKETKKEETTKQIETNTEERRRRRSIKSKKIKESESKKAAAFTKTNKKSSHKDKDNKKDTVKQNVDDKDVALNKMVREKDGERVVSEKETPRHKVRKSKKDVTKETVKSNQSAGNKKIKNKEVASIKAAKEIESVENEIAELKSLDANEVTKEQGTTTNKLVKGKKNKGRKNRKSKGVARRHKVSKGLVVAELETASKLVDTADKSSTKKISSTGKKTRSHRVRKYNAAAESQPVKQTAGIKNVKGAVKASNKITESKETAANKITDEKETNANEVVDNQETSADKVPEFQIVAVVTEVKKMTHHKKITNKEANKKNSEKVTVDNKISKNKEVAANIPKESDDASQTENVERKDTVSNTLASNKEATPASVLKSGDTASIKVNEKINKLVETKEASGTEFMKGSSDTKVRKKEPHSKSISSKEKTAHRKLASKTSHASESTVEKEAASNVVAASRKVSKKKHVVAKSAAKTNNTEAHEATRRIFGGKESVEGEWPWQVSLRGWHNDTYVYNCGGAILSGSFILTAAHCLYPEDANLTDPEQWDVFIGSHNNTKEVEYFQQLHYVKKIYVHEEYDSADKYNDIAIFQLEDPINMADESKGRICLPNNNVPVPESDKQCFITGWGDIVENNTRTSVLKHAPVMTVSTATCNLPGNYNSTVDETEICAGNIQSDTDACMGDSGGSMVCQMGIRWYTTGIVSHGEGCAKPNSYGVYANVTYFKDWIVETILEKSV